MSDSPDNKGRRGAVESTDKVAGEDESLDFTSDSKDAVYVGWSKVSKKSKDTVRTYDDDDTVVYGVGSLRKRPRSHMKQQKKRGPSRLAIALSLVFILATGLLVWHVVSGRAVEGESLRTERVQKKVQDTQDTPAPEPQKKAETPAPKKEEKKEPALTAANIVDIVAGGLSYNDDDMSLPVERFRVDVKDGFVMVYQDLEASVTYNPKDLVTDTSKRIVALAHELSGKRIGEGDGDEFIDATLIVRGSNGKVYLAICEGPTDVRTSDDPYGLIKESKGYVLSSSLLASLGNSGLSTTGGELLVNLDGEDIVADAGISTGNATQDRTPAPAPAPAPQDDGGDNGGDSGNDDGGDGQDNPDDNGDNGDNGDGGGDDNGDN